MTRDTGKRRPAGTKDVGWREIQPPAVHRPADAGELGLFGWILVSLILLGVAAMLILMGLRRLPAYLIEFEDSGESETGP